MKRFVMILGLLLSGCTGTGDVGIGGTTVESQNDNENDAANEATNNNHQPDQAPVCTPVAPMIDCQQAVAANQSECCASSDPDQCTLETTSFRDLTEAEQDVCSPSEG